MSDLQTSFRERRLLIKNLPTLPLVMQEAMRIANSPKVTVNKLSEVIGRDQVLSGKVLKLINSPTYGFPGRISSIQNAMLLLGFNVVKSLIISTVVFECMSNGMTELWRHSIGCSIASREICRLLKMKNGDELFISGLLHDIGKVVTAAQLPEAYEEIRRIALKEDLIWSDAETRVLGLTHARIGAWLAEHWNLPLSLRHAMSYHHRPSSAPDHADMASIVHIGNFLTQLFEFGSGGDEHIHALDPNALKILGIDQRKLGMMIDAAGEKFEQNRIDLF